MMRTVVPFFLMLIVASAAKPMGFDGQYIVRVGHFNPGVDSLLDVYVQPASGPIVVPVDDIPIIVPSSTADFVLFNNGNGSFSMRTQLTGAERALARYWQIADVQLSTRDVDVNGSVDLTLHELDAVVPGAYDQIIFAGLRRGAAPIQVTPINQKFSTYHAQMIRWLSDPEYFNNVPLKVTSVQPSTAFWYGFVGDSSNYSLIFRSISRCEARFPAAYSCGYTTLTPVGSNASNPGCIKPVTLYFGDGSVAGNDPAHDVCQYSIHVYVYVPGSVTLSPDSSVYDTDAKETAEILRRLRVDCPGVPVNDPEDAARLEDILATVYSGRSIVDQARGAVNVLNSFSHPPFPGDGGFDTTDSTYHHYDVETTICVSGQVGCDVTNLREKLRYFSYPNRKLEPRITQVNGERVSVSISLNLFSMDDPEWYVVYGGDITQRFVESGFWQGAIQNVTTSTHIVYPGIISRTIQSSNGRLQVFTHGVGLNRANCTVVPGPMDPYFQMLLGWSNDVYGAAAFRALDKQFKIHFNISPTTLPLSSGGAGGSQKPAFMEAGAAHMGTEGI